MGACNSKVNIILKIIERDNAPYALSSVYDSLYIYAYMSHHIHHTRLPCCSFLAGKRATAILCGHPIRICVADAANASLDRAVDSISTGASHA
jgi:hypothetical protein